MDHKRKIKLMQPQSTRESNYYTKSRKIQTLPDEENTYKFFALRDQYSPSGFDDSETGCDTDINFRLEVQSRKVFQAQLQTLQQENEQLLKIIKQKNYSSLQSNECSECRLWKDKYLEQVKEVETIKDHLRISQSLNKQLSKSNSDRRVTPPPNKSKSPRLSPFSDQARLTNQKQALESQLKITQQNVNNIEKALEIKIIETQEKEKYLTDKIRRLEEQLKAKQNFSSDHEKKALEIKVKEFTQSIEGLNKQIKLQSQESFQNKAQSVKQIQSLQSLIDQLKEGKRSLEAELSKTNIQNITYKEQIDDLQDKVKNYSNKIQKLEKQSSKQREIIDEQLNQVTQLQTQLSLLSQQITKLNQQIENSTKTEERKEDPGISPKKQKELTLMIETLQMENKSLKAQIAILEQTQKHLRSDWREELQTIQKQTETVDTQLNACTLNNKYDDIHFLAETQTSVSEQLNLFHNDMSDGLLQQISQTRNYLDELNALIQ